MTEAQKHKSQVRRSKHWQCFRRKLKSIRRCDEITLMPLRAGWNLHHMDMSDGNYDDLSDEDKFRCYNRLTHKLIHWLFPYYCKDRTIIDRIKNDLEVMRQLNED